jgi:predicted component of type VI protein secretion system
MIGWQRRLVVAAFGGLLVLAACGGSSNKNAATTTTTTTAPTTTLTEQQNKDAIAKVYTDFFNGANPDLNAKLQLVDDPAKYKNVYMKFANDPTTGPELKGSSVTVTNVQLNPDGTAEVTYTLNLNGTPTLKDQKGKAVQVNGQWRVSGTTFCDLAALGATETDPACE